MWVYLHDFVYIILNIFVLNYMEKAIMSFFCGWYFSWWFNTDREKDSSDGLLSSGKISPIGKIYFPDG